MANISEQKEHFELIRQQFEEQELDPEGTKILKKVTDIVNYIGKNFNTLNGGELSELQYKLAGYKYYLVDYTTELSRMAEFYNLSIKETKAKQWNVITKKLSDKFGKIKNKEQIENELMIETEQLYNYQLLFSNYYTKFRLKLSAVDDILTCITQKIASIKRELERNIQ